MNANPTPLLQPINLGDGRIINFLPHPQAPAPVVEFGRAYWEIDFARSTAGPVYTHDPQDLVSGIPVLDAIDLPPACKAAAGITAAVDGAQCPTCGLPLILTSRQHLDEFLRGEHVSCLSCDQEFNAIVHDITAIFHNRFHPMFASAADDLAARATRITGYGPRDIDPDIRAHYEVYNMAATTTYFSPSIADELIRTTPTATLISVMGMCAETLSGTRSTDVATQFVGYAAEPTLDIHGAAVMDMIHHGWIRPIASARAGDSYANATVPLLVAAYKNDGMRWNFLPDNFTAWRDLRDCIDTEPYELVWAKCLTAIRARLLHLGGQGADGVAELARDMVEAEVRTNLQNGLISAGVSPLPYTALCTIAAWLATTYAHLPLGNLLWTTNAVAAGVGTQVRAEFANHTTGPAHTLTPTSKELIAFGNAFWASAPDNPNPPADAATEVEIPKDKLTGHPGAPLFATFGWGDDDIAAAAADATASATGTGTGTGTGNRNTTTTQPAAHLPKLLHGDNPFRALRVADLITCLEVGLSQPVDPAVPMTTTSNQNVTTSQYTGALGWALGLGDGIRHTPISEIINTVYAPQTCPRVRPFDSAVEMMKARGHKNVERFSYIGDSAR